MTRESRLERLEKQLEQAGQDKRDAVYLATLSTLVRQKLKVRVPPRVDSKVFDYEKLRDKQRPTPHGTRLDPDHPPEPPYHCDLKCETCFTQTFPAPIAVSDDQARARITLLTTSINTNLEHLRSALRQHADYIVTKWKKSKAKRAQLLAAVCAQAASRKPGDVKPDCMSLYTKKWAAVHIIDDRSRDDMEDIDAQLRQSTEVAGNP